MRGHGVKKDTYIGADEETTKALTFDLLEHLFIKMDETQEFHIKHIDTCNGRFTSIETKAVIAEKKADKRARRDTAVAATTGFGGGFFAVATTWLKKTFMG